MDNKVLKYLTFIEPKLSEGSKFYENINESVYQTDLYKFAYKDITFDNFDKKYTDTYWNSMSKLFYGDYGKPYEPKSGFNYEQNKKWYDKQKEIFNIIWTYNKKAILVILEKNKSQFPKSNLDKIKNLNYNLSDEFKSSDDVFNKLKNNDYNAFPEEIKSILYNTELNTSALEKYAYNIYNSETTKNNENYGKELRNALKLSDDKAKEVKPKLAKYFTNLGNYDYAVELANICKSVFVDCCLYVFANCIFDSKNNGKSKDVADSTKTDSVATTDGAKPVIKKRKTSSSTIGGVVPKTREQRLESLKRYSGF